MALVSTPRSRFLLHAELIEWLKEIYANSMFHVTSCRLKHGGEAWPIYVPPYPTNCIGEMHHKAQNAWNKMAVNAELIRRLVLDI